MIIIIIMMKESFKMISDVKKPLVDSPHYLNSNSFISGWIRSQLSTKMLFSSLEKIHLCFINVSNLQNSQIYGLILMHI